MFILIEDRRQIQAAQAELEATVGREFTQTALRDIGWQGGRQPQAQVLTDGTFWYWSADHKKEVANPRRLNWFGRIGRGNGVEIAVELNTPYEGRNDQLGGFFARNTDNGRVYLFHSGRVAGGAPGVKKDALVSWCDLDLEAVYAADGSHKEGILVMPVAGRGAVRPAIYYVQSIIDFKAAVRSGDALTNQALAKQHKRRAYFDEFFGRKTGMVAARHIDYVSRHGEVVRTLSAWRTAQGLAKGHAVTKSVLLDLGVEKGKLLLEAYEVKTSAQRGDVYTGIGQLCVHADHEACIRTLVLPADEVLAKDLVSALKRHAITLLRYRLSPTDVQILDPMV